MPRGDDDEQILGELNRVHGSSSVATSSVARAYSATTIPRGMAERFVFSRTCQVCRHPLRGQIDIEIFRTTRTPKQIHAALTPELQSEISIASIANHSKSHVPREHIVRQAVLEETARDMGVAIEEAGDEIINTLSFSRMVLRSAMDKADQATVGEGLAAARLINDLEKAAGGEVDQQIYGMAFKRYLDIAQEIMPPDMFGRLIKAFREDRILQGLIAQRNQGSDTPAAIEATSH